MARDFKVQKTAIVTALAALIIADVGLGIYSWKRQSQQSAQQELVKLQRNVSLLKADIARARGIQKEIPAVQKDCDEFEQSLFPAASGSSSVTAELGAIAAKAGLRLENSSFRRVEVKGRNLTEVQIDASVTGNYRSIVNFVNGLQRSPNLYAIQALQARSDAQNQNSGGTLHVSMHIKTYFRAS